MSSTPRPHDLVWLNHASALEAIAEPWVAQQWRAALPVVVRRDVDGQARIPVGVRGMKREQRAGQHQLCAKRGVVYRLYAGRGAEHEH